MNFSSPLYSLPKAELHVHIEGTLEPDLVMELAQKNQIPLPYATSAELAHAYNFSDLDDFLQLYYRCTAVLRTREDFSRLMVEYLRRAHQQGIKHAEIFCDPQAHTVHGIDPHTVIDGLLDGLAYGQETWGISGGLIVCFLRDRSPEEAAQILESLDDRISNILGVGLDSSEKNYPPELFTTVFATARDKGLHCVAHAGEEAPAEYIWQALRALQIERVDHGVRCLEDEHLIDYLRDHHIPLTVCPSSNVCLRVVPDWISHPLAQMIAKQLVVTINSDDPAYFAGYYLGDIFYKLHDEYAYTYPVLVNLARNSITASFASAERKAELLHNITEWENQYLPST